MPILREHFRFVEKEKHPKKKKAPVVKVAAIGPTTASHLKEKLSLNVVAVAASPGPAELVVAINSAGK